MKRLILFILVSLLITSCNFKSEPLTSIQFKEVMEKEGYRVDKGMDYELIPPSEKLFAFKGDCKAKYLEGYPEGLSYLYSSYVNKLEDSKKKVDKSKNITQDFIHTGSKYTLETNSKFKLVIWRNTMLIYAECPIDRKNEMLKILK